MPSPSSLEAHISATRGPFLEVGGPSPHHLDEPFIDTNIITKPLVVSNVAQNDALEYFWGSRILPRRLVGDYEPIHTGRFAKYLNRPLGAQAKRDEYGMTILEPVDIFADARNLPFKNASLGAIYGVALPSPVEEEFVCSEAPRVIEPGGVLVLERAKLRTPELTGPYFDLLRIKKAGKGLVHFAAARNDTRFR